MRIIAMADLHGHFDIKIPDADVLIVAGDVCCWGNEKEIKAFGEFMGEIPIPNKIYVAGNHDRPLERDREMVERLYLQDVIYLQDSEIVIDGVKFYGTPWQPFFGNWSFNLPRGGPLKNKWALIPSDVNVLITHGPPFGILDDALGCEDLYDRVMQLNNLKLHTFGHIHCWSGERTRNNAIFANVSLCDNSYNIIHEPFVFDI